MEVFAAAAAGSSRTSTVFFILWCNRDPYCMENETTIWIRGESMCLYFTSKPHIL